MNITIWGKKVINRTTTIAAATKGQMDLLSLARGTLEILEVTNSNMPTGGVHRPMVSIRQKIIPKWMGSRPTAMAKG